MNVIAFKSRKLLQRHRWAAAYHRRNVKHTSYIEKKKFSNSHEMFSSSDSLAIANMIVVRRNYKMCLLTVLFVFSHYCQLLYILFILFYLDLHKFSFHKIRKHTTEKKIQPITLQGKIRNRSQISGTSINPQN